MIYAISTNDFAKITNKVANVFGEIAKTDRKVAKSVERFATLNKKNIYNDNIFAIMID